MQCRRSDFGFAKPLRLLKAAHYRYVFDHAPIRAAHPQLLILTRPNNLSHPRLGLIVAKKHVRRACDRNRIKRIARETFRLQQHHLFHFDAIVLARSGIDKLSKEALTQLLNKQWRKLTQRARKLQNPAPTGERAHSGGSPDSRPPPKAKQNRS